jgi:hypothetical protein
MTAIPELMPALPVTRYAIVKVEALPVTRQLTVLARLRNDESIKVYLLSSSAHES